MKLVMSIVNNDDARGLSQALVREGYRATMVGTTGGFLRMGNTTILCGVEGDQVASVLRIIRENCCTRTETVYPLPPALSADGAYWPAPGQEDALWPTSMEDDVYSTTPTEVEVGGATVFVFNVVHYE